MPLVAQGPGKDKIALMDKEKSITFSLNGNYKSQSIDISIIIKLKIIL